ncbi:hypothetical protein AN958_09657 [Leucoagaricus sp. SymC.cos]|nr:hypothetical protein AN958_09657 [Leucoagaricus sp. SymC.cos]
MATNRPRPSLIKLFDPLVNSTNSEIPSTPRRDSVDAQADKENKSASPFNSLTMTMFVNKISNPLPHPQPTPLKRRLVDIGDMTLEDAACPDALLDESIEEEFNANFEQAGIEDENATLTFRDMVKAATPLKTLKTVLESPVAQSSPANRTPLANISQGQETSLCLPEAPSSSELITGQLAPEGVLAEVSSPQEPTNPDLVLESNVAPEDVPLPPSPIMSTRDLLPADVVPDQRLPTHLRASSSTASSLEIPSLESSSNTPSPTANTSDSSESSGISSTNTSIPIVVSDSSPPSSPILPQVKSESDDVVSPLPMLRPNLPIGNEQNRVSVDLHASFQMQMQSEEMSFDLLSDKVSFLQGGMESFLTTTEEDPSFDLEAERVNMEKALKKYVETGKEPKEIEEKKASLVDGTSSASSSPAPVTPIDIPSVPSTPSHPSCDTRQPNGTVNIKTVKKRLSIPIAVSSPRLIDVSLVSTSPLTRSSSLSSPFSPAGGGPSALPVRSSVQRSPTSTSGSVFVPPPNLGKKRASLQLVTPKTVGESALPSMPPAIPALKIVKRSRPGHDRNDSSLGNTAFNTIAEQKTCIDAGTTRDLGSSTIGPLKTRKSVKVPEMGAPSEPASQVISRQPARPRTIAPRASLSSTQASGLGPRRVPVSEGPQLKAAAPLARSTTMPASTTGGPRRVPAPSSSVLPTPRPSISTTGGLKAPAQAGTTSSTTTATSSLPKPSSRLSISRLPAPKSLKTGGLPTLRRAT